MQRMLLGAMVGATLVAGMPAFAQDTDRNALMTAHRGGKLTLLAPGFDGSIDPQIAYDELTWQIHAVVYDQLLTFQKVDGEASNVVVPDLAEALPEVSDDGRTLTFKLRRGIRFSNGAEVTTADVRASFERMFKVASPTSDKFYTGIVGADACVAQRASCSLEQGIEIDPATNTVTFHLVAPDAEFLSKVAMFHASIVPADTPPTDQGVVPPLGTGPYMITEYDPATGLTAVRNPEFKEWSAEAQPDGYVDEIHYTFGLDSNSALNAVLNNQADWMFHRVPTERLGEISASYSDRAHIHNEVSYWLAPMNTTIPPFNDVRVRQALAYAVDRAALVNQYGGPNLATPICQHLPVGIPGHVDFCDYTVNPGTSWSGPDMDRARALIAEAGVAGQKVTVFGDDRHNVRENALYLQSLLTELGFDAEVKILSDSLYWNYINNTENKVQISVHRWMLDYPEPGNFIGALFTCANIREASSSNVNLSGFCDPTLEQMIADANTATLKDRAAGAEAWSKIDRYVTENAPAVPLHQPKILDVFSSRVGGAPIAFSGLASVTLSSLWVQ